MPKVIVITGASSGIGRLTAEALARAGHTVYASMRDIDEHNAAQAAKIAELASAEAIDIRVLELNVQQQDSADAAILRVLDDCGQLDVLVHNAGHMVYGPSEAFTPDQLAEIYDINVIGTQRVNRAALPHMRRQDESLLVWVSSSSCAGGTPPYLGPYFAAKAAIESLAVTYARELARWGVETSIVVPGAFTTGTNHFLHATAPAEQTILDEYNAGPYANFGPQVMQAFNAIVPTDANPAAVADSIVTIVDTPHGQRPFRAVIDPSHDGADVGFAVLDRLKEEMLHRIGFSDLLRPA